MSELEKKMEGVISYTITWIFVPVNLLERSGKLCHMTLLV